MITLAKWSVEDYHRMIESGILSDRSVELLDGNIIEMSAEGPLHSAMIDNVAEYLRALLRGIARIREAHPITLLNSEPEPDIAIVRLTDNNYAERHPGVKDIYWLIEIANTTLGQDLSIKKEIYAQAGISEYWVIDLKAKEIIVFREPFDSDYKNKLTVNKGTISPVAFPDVQVAIIQLLNLS